MRQKDLSNTQEDLAIDFEVPKPAYCIILFCLSIIGTIFNVSLFFMAGAPETNRNITWNKVRSGRSCWCSSWQGRTWSSQWTSFSAAVWRCAWWYREANRICLWQVQQPGNDLAGEYSHPKPLPTSNRSNKIVTILSASKFTFKYRHHYLPIRHHLFI